MWKHALAAVARGELIGIATESNYLIGGRSDHKDTLGALRAIERLVGAKECVFVILGASQAHLQPLAAHWAPPLRRLASRYWPGPFVMKVRPSAKARELLGRHAQWIQLRVPAHADSQHLIQKLEVPIAAVEPERNGSVTIFSARELPGILQKRAAAFVDAERNNPRIAPALIQFAPPTFRVEREGLLSEEDLRRVAGRRVLFVCTGNTCRSPMAAALLRARVVELLAGKRLADAAAERQLLEDCGYRIESAGIAPFPGAPASPHAQAAVAQCQLSLADHRAQVATQELLQQFDVVLAMSGQHLQRLSEFAPDCANVELLDPESDIQDPFGGTLEDYLSTLARIRAAIEVKIEKLA